MARPDLLKTPSECEYPAEFLAARLLGKRGALFRNWEFLIAGSDAVASLQNTVFYPYLKKYAAPGIWRFLHHEHLWVYKRMNNTLRRAFAPYFTYHEIQTLISCLRYISAKKENERVRQLLHNSLLHDSIQDILTSDLDFDPLLRTLELSLCRQSDLFGGIGEHYEKGGVAALEVYMRGCFLSFLLAQKQPAMLKIFLQHLVDFHNCLGLAKSLRWQIDAEPDMIDGGTVPAELFPKAYSRKDMTPVLKFLHIKIPDEAASAIQQLETVLLGFISQKLKRWSLQRTVVGDILFYLWEQYRYSRNISMVLNTIQLDDELVRESIVA